MNSSGLRAQSWPNEFEPAFARLGGWSGDHPLLAKPERRFTLALGAKPSTPARRGYCDGRTNRVLLWGEPARLGLRRSVVRAGRPGFTPQAGLGAPLRSQTGLVGIEGADAVHIGRHVAGEPKGVAEPAGAVTRSP